MDKKQKPVTKHAKAAAVSKKGNSSASKNSWIDKVNNAVSDVSSFKLRDNNIEDTEVEVNFKSNDLFEYHKSIENTEGDQIIQNSLQYLQKRKAEKNNEITLKQQKEEFKRLMQGVKTNESEQSSELLLPDLNSSAQLKSLADPTGSSSVSASAEGDNFSSLNTNQQRDEVEKQMQKYEADIRNHISIEQQLQVYIDSLKQKIEDFENEKPSEEQQIKEEATLKHLEEKNKTICNLQIKNEYMQIDLDSKNDEIQKLKKTSEEKIAKLLSENTQLKEENEKIKGQYKKLQVQLLQKQDEIIRNSDMAPNTARDKSPNALTMPKKNMQIKSTWFGGKNQIQETESQFEQTQPKNRHSAYNIMTKGLKIQNSNAQLYLKRADDLRSKRTSVIVQSEQILDQISSKGGSMVSKKGLALVENDRNATINTIVNYPYSGGGTGEQSSSQRVSQPPGTQQRNHANKVAGKTTIVVKNDRLRNTSSNLNGAQSSREISRGSRNYIQHQRLHSNSQIDIPNKDIKHTLNSAQSTSILKSSIDMKSLTQKREYSKQDVLSSRQRLPSSHVSSVANLKPSSSSNVLIASVKKMKHSQSSIGDQQVPMQITQTYTQNQIQMQRKQYEIQQIQKTYNNPVAYGHRRAKTGNTVNKDNTKKATSDYIQKNKNISRVIPQTRVGQIDLRKSQDVFVSFTKR